MALEAIIEPGIKDFYGFETVAKTTGEPVQLDLSKMIKQLVIRYKREHSGRNYFR